MSKWNKGRSGTPHASINFFRHIHSCYIGDRVLFTFVIPFISSVQLPGGSHSPHGLNAAIVQTGQAFGDQRGLLLEPKNRTNAIVKEFVSKCVPITYRPKDLRRKAGSRNLNLSFSKSEAIYWSSMSIEHKHDICHTDRLSSR